MSNLICTPQAHAPAGWSGAKDATCPACDRPRCVAKSSRKDERCRKQPIKGARVCRTHGGSAPQVRDAAERRLEERRAVLALETFGLPVEVDPHTALLEELHRTAGAVAWLGAMVADLTSGQVTWGKTRDTTGEDAGMTTFEARPNAWVELWHRERKHLLEVSKTCISLGIEERRVRLAEDAGRQLATVVRAVLERLDLSEDQQRLATVVVPEEFRRVHEISSTQPSTSTDTDTSTDTSTDTGGDAA